MRRALAISGLIVLGVLAAVSLYLACIMILVLGGGLFYSVALGAILAAVVAVAVLVYLLARRRERTSWPIVATMVVVQFGIVAVAVCDSPSTALMLFR